MHPKFDGKIYRGVAFDKDKGEKLLSELKAKKSNGATTDMKGISSWSSAENVADEFADNRPGEYKFIFEMNNKSGVGIDHLSEWFGEAEVLHSKTAKYIVKDIVPVENHKNRYRIILEESE